MKPAAWIRVRPKDLREAEVAEIEGVEVTLLVSPYDIPDAVRGYYDQDLKRFVLELKYLQDEKWNREDVDQHTWARVGATSGRVRGIELDVDALGVGVVELRVQAERALASLGRASNTNLVKKAIDQAFPKILPGFLEYRRERTARHGLA